MSAFPGDRLFPSHPLLTNLKKALPKEREGEKKESHGPMPFSSRPSLSSLRTQKKATFPAIPLCFPLEREIAPPLAVWAGNNSRRAGAGVAANYKRGRGKKREQCLENARSGAKGVSKRRGKHIRLRDIVLTTMGKVVLICQDAIFWWKIWNIRPAAVASIIEASY